MNGDLEASSRPSASGARLTGDDLQHLIVWYWCLKAANPASDVEAVTVEADDAGNIDDVVVDLGDGRRIYHQVKATVSAGKLTNVNWLVEPAGRRGISILQRLYRSWLDLGSPSAGIALITSRPIDPNDQLLAGLDYRNRLGNHLRRAPDESEVSSLRHQLAEHLDSPEAQICDFFDALEIRLGQTEAEWRQKVEDVAMGAGVQLGDTARAAALADIRDWVKTTRDRRSRAAIFDMIERLDLRAEEPRAVVVVQMVDTVPTDDAIAVINWTAKTRGDRPETRRGLIDPSEWKTTLTEDLDRLREQLHADGWHRVLVRGAMRLPTWFAVGASLREVAGFNVAASFRGERWTADPSSAPIPRVQVLTDEAAGDGPEVGLTVAMSYDPTHTVRRALTSNPDIGRFVTVSVDGGPHPRVFKGPADSAAAAVAARNWVRDAEIGTRIHLVLVAPAPFALFLGHFWDRVPPTTIYEDLAPGYEPAFSVTN